MSKRTRMRAAVLAAAVMGLAAAGFLAMRTPIPRPKPEATKSQPVGSVTVSSTLPELSRAIARGDGMALAVLKSRMETKADGTSSADLEPITDTQAKEWAGVLASLRAGSSRFSAFGRASGVVVASEILKRFATRPAPPTWIAVLEPSAAILETAMADNAWEVRVAALSEIKGLWKWMPNRDLFPVERRELVKWRSAFLGPVQARLKDREPGARGAAVASLGDRPDDQAEPAVRLIDDPDPGVRIQVLLSFIQRPDLLTEETVLPKLYDPSEFVPPMAERVLKTRGLSPEQIGLGKLVVHPRPEMRTTAIPFLKDRHDIDPVVWLLYLSRDREESVRAKALEALGEHQGPEARQRVAEMAAGDVSPAIREAAGKFLSDGDRTAIALPPLPVPSSRSMTIKAN